MSKAPLPASALRASGSRHYSKEQLAAREAAEVKVPNGKGLAPPAYLPHSLSEKFAHLAPILSDLGLLTQLDGDCLARYLIAESNYLRATNKLSTAINTGNTGDADKWSAMQDRFFKQCRAAGSDLGLSASGRGRISVPQEVRPPVQSEVDLFGS